MALSRVIGQMIKGCYASKESLIRILDKAGLKKSWLEVKRSLGVGKECETRVEQLTSPEQTQR